jgi:hypothetical protein
MEERNTQRKKNEVTEVKIVGKTDIETEKKRDE